MPAVSVSITGVMLSLNCDKASQVFPIADVTGAFVGFDVIPPCIGGNINQVETVSLVSREKDFSCL